MEVHTYWDSSAVVAATMDDTTRNILESPGPHTTRTHTLSEVFSTITGGRLGFRLDANEATKLLLELAQHFSFIDLAASEVLEALLEARDKGVRGGQVHDYLHAVAAMKANCQALLTLNSSDFNGLFTTLQIIEP